MIPRPPTRRPDGGGLVGGSPDPTSPRAPVRAPAIRRRVRLASGLVLLCFVAMHLADLALGLSSIGAMDRGRAWSLAPWQPWPCQALLLGAAVAHAVLGLQALAARRTLRLSRTDWVQLLLGLATPPLILAHVVSLQVASDLDRAFDADYGFALAVYWRYAPAYALQQLAAVLAVYVHGVVGLQAWLVLRPSWPRVAPFLLPAAFALPVLALLGFAQAGQEVLLRLDREPVWAARVAADLDLLGALRGRLDAIEEAVLLAYGAALAAAALALCVNLLRLRSRPIAVDYGDGLAVRGRAGLSILDVSRLGHVPHAQVCSGRGRCGTCLVTVDREGALAPIGGTEAATLARVDAPTGARLACQARLLGEPLSVGRLRPAFADATDARDPSDGDGRREYAGGTAR